MATISNKIEVIKGDITKIIVDVVVNAANTSLLGGGGVDGAIHRAGGVAILNECKKIVGRQGGCKTGEAVITTAGNLPAKFVIHTVGPVWNGGENYEAQKLEDCYRNSLQLAGDNDCRSIAFPGISTGVYRFPKNDAAKIAVSTVYKFLSRPGKIDKVIFVCFDYEYYTLITQQIENLL
jgi:O-acetyl-ADP-ribose deacetylase (regulator of RNase III)